jgi:NRPS condensation-like uncharacterized protein
VNRHLPSRTGTGTATEPGQLPCSPFGLIDELSCYYDTAAEPNNELFEVQLPGAIDYPTLRRAVAGALAAAPRARGRMAAGHALRRRYTWEFPAAPDIDPLSQTTWSDERELAVIRVGFMASSPPLRTSPPIRLLLASGPDASCVMLNAHHAAMDGMSCVEFLRDIAARYRAIAGDPPHALTSAHWRPESPGPLDAPEPRSPRSPLGPAPLPQSSGPVRAVRRYLVARIAPERERRERRDGSGLRLLLVPAVPRRHGATVNDLLVAALIATISRWNAAHRRPPAAIRITVPVSVREPGLRGVAGNHTRIATVTADPWTAADLSELLAVVTRQTSALRQAGRQRASAGPLGLAPGWCPVGLKRLAVRTALRGLGRFVCDTTMLTNLGNVPDPPWSGSGRPVRMAVAGPARMPRGLAVGAMTADGQLQLSFRYRHALFDEAAGARFVTLYAAALDELTTDTREQTNKQTNEPTDDRTDKRTALNGQGGDTGGPTASADQDSRLPGRQGQPAVFRGRGPAL